ncbi:MAG TPA: chorismate mutase [Solirubrobacterales bacterium]|nr:chorismate mutase [Solirubrobacterales bacterium]
MTEPSPDLRLWAVRGAVQAGHNDEESILGSTEELLRELIERNRLEPERMVSCIFTCTADLDAQFPAVAARRLGLDGVPLICAREIDVPGSMPRVIRVLVHYHAGPDHDPAHTYLGEAKKLRSDLHSAQ